MQGGARPPTLCRRPRGAPLACPRRSVKSLSASPRCAYRESSPKSRRRGADAGREGHVTDLRESGEVSTGELLDNRYVLQERIGEGGMARVYRADDTHLQRSVAVKVFREPTDGIDSVQRALSET